MAYHPHFEEVYEDGSSRWVFKDGPFMWDAKCGTSAKEPKEMPLTLKDFWGIKHFDWSEKEKEIEKEKEMMTDQAKAMKILMDEHEFVIANCTDILARMAANEPNAFIKAFEELTEEVKDSSSKDSSSKETDYERELFMSDVRNFIEADKKIQAIKLYREKTGLGLKESKEAVEEITCKMFGVSDICGDGCGFKHKCSSDCRRGDMECIRIHREALEALKKGHV